VSFTAVLIFEQINPGRQFCLDHPGTTGAILQLPRRRANGDTRAIRSEHLMREKLCRLPCFVCASRTSACAVSALLLFAALLLPVAATAQIAPPPGAGSRGTAAEQKACEPDARRLCRQAINMGDMAVLACFQQQRARLSRACAAVLRKHGQIQ
jgi:hypothetical protein